MPTPDASPPVTSPTLDAPPDPRPLWRVLLAALAPLPPLLIAMATLLAPYPMQGEFADILSGAAASPGRMQAALWLNLLAVLTLLPATAAVAWVCRRRTPRLAAVAAILAVPGLTAAIALPNDELTALSAAGESLDRDTVLALNQNLWNQPTTLVALAVFLIGMVVGGVLLGLALWRSRVAPRAMGLALVVGSILHLAPGFAGNGVTALSWVLTAVGYTAASIALLRTSDDQFDLSPQVDESGH